MSVPYRRFSPARVSLPVLLVLAVTVGVPPAMAQSSSTPPTPKAALWWGEVWGTAEMSPKIVRPGDDVTITATTWNGGVGGPAWQCGNGGWHVVGTHTVEVSRLAGCFDLVDYEPKASEFVGVSVRSDRVVWSASAGPPPTDDTSQYNSIKYNDTCYCWVGWFGARRDTRGCPLPIGTFRRGQTFRLYLKAKNTSGCSTRGNYTRPEGARFSGAAGVSWNDYAEIYYRFDGPTSPPPPIPAIELTADQRSVPVGTKVTVTARVTDTGTGAPMPGQTVNFRVNVGQLSALIAITDSQGNATVELSDDGLPGRSRVVASIPQASDTEEVEFTPNPGGAGGSGPLLRRYFAEGSTEWQFTTDIALLNPGEGAARARLELLTAAGTTLTEEVTVPARARKSVRLNSDVPGLAQTAVSTVVESSVPLVADRTMTWDGSGYGSHTETSIETPRTTWYLAEGATHSGFDLFYLIQNPQSEEVNVTVRYLRTAPHPPIVKTYSVGPRSRFNIWVNYEGPELASAEISAVITASAPVIVERAMYLNAGGLMFGAGHESAGIPEPATRWFFAEGATGPYFDLFILVGNPDTRTANVRATYLLPDGSTVERTYTVAPQSRFNIWVDYEDARLADTAVSTVIESTNGVPVIAERAMWWPGPTAATWHEAHNSAGTTTTGTEWAMADAEQGGPRGVETYVLIANTSATAASVRVTLLFEDGTTEERTFAVAARSRFNVSIGNEFPAATGRRFGVVVKSLGETAPAQLVVERAVYANARGVRWAAGSNAVATKLK